MDNTRLVEGNTYFEVVARHEGFYSEELMEQLAAVGSLEELDVPGWVKNVFRVSHDIDPRWHVRMQAAFPGIHGQRRVQDHQLPSRRHR